MWLPNEYSEITIAGISNTKYSYKFCEGPSDANY